MDGHDAFGITKALTPRARQLRYGKTDYDDIEVPPVGLRGTIKQRGLTNKTLRRLALRDARKGNQRKLF